MARKFSLVALMALPVFGMPKQEKSCYSLSDMRGTSSPPFFSSDGKKVLTVATDNARIWDAETGKELHDTRTMFPKYGMPNQDWHCEHWKGIQI
jgi:WD40 repeat protein